MIEKLSFIHILAHRQEGAMRKAAELTLVAPGRTTLTLTTLGYEMGQFVAVAAAAHGRRADAR